MDGITICFICYYIIGILYGEFLFNKLYIQFDDISNFGKWMFLGSCLIFFMPLWIVKITRMLNEEYKNYEKI